MPELWQYVLRRDGPANAVLTGFFVDENGAQLGDEVTLSVTNTPQTLFAMLGSEAARSSSGYLRNGLFARRFIGALSGAGFRYGLGGAPGGSATYSPGTGAPLIGLPAVGSTNVVELGGP